MTDSLIELRADIDAIDRDIIALLAKRFAVVHRVAVVKKREGLPAVLPERIAVVKRQARALAENAGLSPDLRRKPLSPDYRRGLPTGRGVPARQIERMMRLSVVVATGVNQQRLSIAHAGNPIDQPMLTVDTARPAPCVISF